MTLSPLPGAGTTMGPKLFPGTYTVFNVESGDKLTFLLNSSTPASATINTVKPQSTPEMITKGVIISGITVPRMAKGGANAPTGTALNTNVGVDNKAMTAGSVAINDEPYAFEAFEFIRSSCIGKVVTFIPEYEIETIERTVGRVILPLSSGVNNSGNVGEDAAEALLKRGLATVNNLSFVQINNNLANTGNLNNYNVSLISKGSAAALVDGESSISNNNGSRAQQLKQLQQDYKDRKEKLTSLEKVARNSKIGIFNPKGKESHVRPRFPFPPANIVEFVASRKNTVEKLRVDRVQSATALIVSTTFAGNNDNHPNNHPHQQFILHLTGISPVGNLTTISAGTGVALSALIREAKQFVERKLLARQINVAFEGTDSFLNILGTPQRSAVINVDKNSKGDNNNCFQCELLSRGYARISPVTISNVIDDNQRNSMRAAEKEAQDGKLGVWAIYNTNKVEGEEQRDGKHAGVPSNLVPNTNTGNNNVGFSNNITDFEATLLQVLSGDLILVKPIEEGVSSLIYNNNNNNSRYVRVSLTGLRVAKPLKDFSSTAETKVVYGDYSWEARELLIKNFLGKVVTVHVDYTRFFDSDNKGNSSESAKGDAERQMLISGTVTEASSGVNIAAAVIENGFGKVSLGGGGGGGPSANNPAIGKISPHVVSLLQDAEAIAKAKGAGLYNSQDVSGSAHANNKGGYNSNNPVVIVKELGRLGANKAQYYLDFLRRQQHGGGKGGGGSSVLTHAGIVDNVISGGYFRVYLPREHFQVGFKIAGIISPMGGFTAPKAANSSGGSVQNDPFWAESKDFALVSLTQRQVEISIETFDKGGNFVGTLSLVDNNLSKSSNNKTISRPGSQGGEEGGKGAPSFLTGKKVVVDNNNGAVTKPRKDKANYAVMIVRAGLAVVDSFTAPSLPFYNELIAAEKEARDEKRFIWSNESEFLPKRRVLQDNEDNYYNNNDHRGEGQGGSALGGGIISGGGKSSIAVKFETFYPSVLSNTGGKNNNSNVGGGKIIYGFGKNDEEKNDAGVAENNDCVNDGVNSIVRQLTSYQPVSILNVEDGNTITVGYAKNDKIREKVTKSIKKVVERTTGAVDFAQNVEFTDETKKGTNKGKNKGGKDVNKSNNTFKRDEFVLAYYKEDKSWYRASVVRNYDAATAKDDKVPILFLDYNTVCEVPKAKIIKLAELETEAEGEEGEMRSQKEILEEIKLLQSLPPLCVTVKLSLLRSINNVSLSSSSSSSVNKGNKAWGGGGKGGNKSYGGKGDGGDYTFVNDACCAIWDYLDLIGNITNGKKKDLGGDVDNDNLLFGKMEYVIGNDYYMTIGNSFHVNSLNNNNDKSEESKVEKGKAENDAAKNTKNGKKLLLSSQNEKDKNRVNQDEEEKEQAQLRLTLSSYLLSKGLALVDKRFSNVNKIDELIDIDLVKQALSMVEEAKKKHVGMWSHGDIGLEDEEYYNNY